MNDIVDDVALEAQNIGVDFRHKDHRRCLTTVFDLIRDRLGFSFPRPYDEALATIDKVGEDALDDVEMGVSIAWDSVVSAILGGQARQGDNETGTDSIGNTVHVGDAIVVPNDESGPSVPDVGFVRAIFDERIPVAICDYLTDGTRLEGRDRHVMVSGSLLVRLQD